MAKKPAVRKPPPKRSVVGRLLTPDEFGAGLSEFGLRPGTISTRPQLVRHEHGHRVGEDLHPFDRRGRGRHRLPLCDDREVRVCHGERDLVLDDRLVGASPRFEGLGDAHPGATHAEVERFP